MLPPGVGTRVDGGQSSLDESMDDAPRQQPLSSNFRQQQMQQQQQQQPLQRQRRQFLRPSGPSLPNPTPSRQARLRASVETLVRKLSRQNLQTTDAGSVQQRAISSPSVSPNIAAVSDQPLAKGNPTKRRDDSPSRSPLVPSTQPDFPVPTRPITPRSPIDVDEVIGPAAVPHTAPRIRRPQCYYPIPNAMDLDRDEGLDFGLTSFRLPEPVAPVSSERPPIVPPDLLEVDEAYLNGPSTIDERDLEDEATLIERYRAMRRTATPGGTMRRNVDGVPLRFRLSADVALRCPNLVLSKPRMRRRRRRSARPEDAEERKREHAGPSTTDASTATAAADSQLHSHL
ncbi:hypothetical protein OQA88_3392 [Cercophora sp. LCS_1]